jgi:uncharacterized membrane protein YphA (DoxX/SURF4 family)
MEPTILLSNEWSAAPRVSARIARPRARRGISATLWTAQVLLALLFLFAGVMKFLTPAAVLAKQSPFPVWFIWFIGVVEVLGALGLVLPGLFRIRTDLTPLAAAGLVIIMSGAVVTTIATAPVSMAAVPAVVGVLAAWVAYARTHVVR